jgi:hypothetical protein
MQQGFDGDSDDCGPGARDRRLRANVIVGGDAMTIAPTQPFPLKTASQPIGTGSVLAEAWSCTMRFYWNKLRQALVPGETKTAEDGSIQFARATLGNASAELPYCMSRDARGIMCGVQPAWLYLDDFASAGPNRVAIIRQLLARLPGGVSFHFAFRSNLSDGASVRRAFAGCGFKILEWATYVYTPPASHTGTLAELIDTFSGKSIKGTLRRALRDLEVVDLSVGDYIGLQRANLAAEGKKNNRNDNLDELILKEAMRRNCVRVLAARRKSTDTHPGPHPVDAALVCLWDEKARISQLWRLTYCHRDDGPNKTNVDASKLLVLAAMQDAAERKFVLDTDGYTSGMAKLYGLFGPGVFQLADRLHCERECLWAILIRYYPSLGRLRGLVRRSRTGLKPVSLPGPA